MKKQYLVSTFIILLLFASGCTKNPTPSDTSNKEVNVKETKVNDKPISTTNVVDNNFSSEDLIYFIMTDRFYNADTSDDKSDVNKNDPKAYHGGDLKGVIDKLDYIKSLGTTAIWITPVVKNEPQGYHGYWTEDFYSVDSHLGDMAILKELVTQAHKRDMKVLLDHVINHTGYKSSWLTDESKKDWFHPKLDISNWNDQDQVENGWLAGLPDLNTENPQVKKYLLDNTLWWIEQTGVDGMRLDTVRHVPKEFWQEFTKTIKEKHPSFYFLGEVWNENPRYLEEYHKLGLDGLTNYSMFKGIRESFTRFGKTNPLISAIKREKSFTSPEENGIFVDNHDNTRLITQGRENGSEYLKQALTFIMTYPSIPIIYYGTEIGMEGGADPDNRRDMEWDKVENNDMLTFYKSLADLRKTNPAIISGEFKLLDYDDYFISYMREKDGKSIIVIINLQTKDRDVVINIPNKTKVFKDLITSKDFKVKDQKLDISLKQLDLIILESIN
ncbi:alpha-amylase family glycosyl hydrolase [Clostridium sp.]|uniref:alpha-amylase family glycosyl hydrolase n=1 Tax=Clostridium sp. TaxID=1506 RepID=UPI003D6CCE2B